MGQYQLHEVRRLALLHPAKSSKLTYGKACRHYLEAYYRDSSSFNLDQIGRAIDACELAEDFETAETFHRFEDDYAPRHLREVRHAPAWLKDQTATLHDLPESPYA